MAMSKCKECGKAVSTLAKTCPNCGVPKPALKIKIKKKIAAKTKKNKPHGLSTNKTSNQQYVYNQNTGSFDKSSSKIKNEENYDSKTGYNPRTGSFEKGPKKTKILKANDKINKEEQTRRQDEFKRNKQYWKDQEQIRKQDELRRKEEEQIRREEELRQKKLVWAHCSNRKCKDYTQMYQFKKSELADVYETCNVCKNNFKEANVENGRPIMPTDGTYERQATYHSTSVSSSSTNTGEGDTFDKFEKGTLDLPTAFWGFFTFGSVIVGVICGALSEMVHKFFNIPYVLIMFFILSSTWKCAENYKKTMDKKNQSVVWGVLTQICCVVSFLGLAVFIYDSFQ